MQSILLVEDSKTQALRFSHVFEEAGYTVDCVHAAEDVFIKLASILPDLIITDYNLPGMPGDELCRRIRLDTGARALPIIMLTSEKAEQTEQLALESGADDYVRKSDFDEIMLARIEALSRKISDEPRFVEKICPGDNKILVVDDSDTYREYIAMGLERLGYRTEMASSGAEALKLIRTQTFDGVVLDMILPDMHGVKMCRQFAEARSDLGHHFVFLMLTGGEDLREMNEVLAAGADDVVGKSKDFKIIAARLQALIRRKRQ